MATAKGPSTQWRSREERRAGHPPPLTRTRELSRAFGLLRRFVGGRRVLVLALLLLVIEAATAVIEPVPIAFLIDFLQGSRPPLREMGLPPLLASAFIETIAVATAGLVLIAAINSAADSLAEICFARAGRTFGYNVRVALYAASPQARLGLPRPAPHRRRADQGDRRRDGDGGVRRQVGQRPDR